VVAVSLVLHSQGKAAQGRRDRRPGDRRRLINLAALRSGRLQVCYIAPMATAATANSAAAMKAKVTRAMVRRIALKRPSS